MRLYIRSYKNRGVRILLLIVIIAALLLVNGWLFQEKAIRITNQLNSYNDADYSLVYILNYEAPLNNECIFVDTDVMLYKDAGKLERIAASAFMKNADTQYDIDSLSVLSELSPNHISISQNIATEYSIHQGDVLYAQFSYTEQIIEYTVDAIATTNFDLQNPNVDNNIGIVYMGYDSNYLKNTHCKYALFSEKTKADVLSEYPQIINSIISKSDNGTAIFKQGLPLLIILAFVTVAILLLSNLMFFSKSKEILTRCYLKGMRKSIILMLPTAEKIVFCLIPIIVVERIQQFVIPCNSIFTEIYYGIPVTFTIIYILGAFAMDAIKGRRKY